MPSTELEEAVHEVLARLLAVADDVEAGILLPLSHSSVASRLAAPSSAPLEFHCGQSLSVSASQDGLGRLPAMRSRTSNASSSGATRRLAKSATPGLRYRRRVSSDADPTAAGAQAPLGAADRIAALDVLRGFALLGIFIMNMPGFSHSMFAAPAPPRGALDLLVAGLRETAVRGQVQSSLRPRLRRRLRAADGAPRERRVGAPRRAPARDGAIRIYARRMAFLTVVGLVHAMLLWSGDVLLVYALIGFACSACAAWAIARSAS